MNSSKCICTNCIIVEQKRQVAVQAMFSTSDSEKERSEFAVAQVQFPCTNP